VTHKGFERYGVTGFLSFVQVFSMLFCCEWVFFSKGCGFRSFNLPYSFGVWSTFNLICQFSVFSKLSVAFSLSWRGLV
jgi:hypothetical protein